MLATGAVWEVRRVRASAPPEPERTFGMVGITRGQTMRLNVVNLSNPPDPDRQHPPDPCRVVLSFRAIYQYQAASLMASCMPWIFCPRKIK